MSDPGPTRGFWIALFRNPAPLAILCVAPVLGAIANLSFGGKGAEPGSTVARALFGASGGLIGALVFLWKGQRPSAGVASTATTGSRNSSAVERILEEAARLGNEAYAKVEQGDVQGARRLLEKSLKLSDDIAAVHSEYALILMGVGEPKRAYRSLMRALELAPRTAKYWANLSAWHFSQREFEPAMKSILMAERCDSRYPSIPVAKRNILTQTGADPATLTQWTEQARALYNERGARADGNALKPGEIEMFLFPRRPLR